MRTLRCEGQTVRTSTAMSRSVAWRSPQTRARTLASEPSTATRQVRPCLPGRASVLMGAPCPYRNFSYLERTSPRGRKSLVLRTCALPRQRALTRRTATTRRAMGDRVGLRGGGVVLPVRAETERAEQARDEEQAREQAGHGTQRAEHEEGPGVGVAGPRRRTEVDREVDEVAPGDQAAGDGEGEREGGPVERRLLLRSLVAIPPASP